MQMKTVFLCGSSLLLAWQLSAQTTATFEDLAVPADSFLNNAMPAATFASGHVALPNSFNEEFQSWTGWAISTSTDTLTPGFTNQHSAIPGQGAEGSATYAVGFSSGENRIYLTEAALGGVVEGMYITNSTYAYLSMRDGDSFAKRFGGESGDDPDFFKLTIKKYFHGALSEDSVDFFLADYRFEDNSQDYLVDEWTYVDLRSLGNVDSLAFSLSSTDVGQFGMNTPAYVCIDHLITADMPTNRDKLDGEAGFSVYPNPTTQVVTVEWAQPGSHFLEVFDMQGRRQLRAPLHVGENHIELGALPRGMYLLRAGNGQLLGTKKLMLR